MPKVKTDTASTRRSLEALTAGQYELVRDRWLARIIETKKRRRISLGQDCTVTFENRALIEFYLQERLRADNVTSSQRMEDIIAEHHALLPYPGELRATLLIHGADNARCGLLAKRLCDTFSPISLSIGGNRIRGSAIAPSPGAVHYLSFTLPANGNRKIGMRGMSLSLAYEEECVEVTVPTPAVCEIVRDLQMCHGRCQLVTSQVRKHA